MITTTRRAAALLAGIALAASLGLAVAGTTTTDRAAHASLQVDVGEAASRIELLRPRGYSGGDQPESKRPRAVIGALIGAALPQNGIQYHGGPVVMGEKVVAIYWGNSPVFTGGPTPGSTGAASADGSLVGYFLSNLGGTPYYNINSTYTDGAGNPIPNVLSYTGYWANNTNVAADCQIVSDSAIQQMIVSGFTSGKIAFDPSTVYAVFSAGKVNLGGNFGNCSGTQFQYCAYHGYFSYNGNTVLYAAMPYNAAYTGSGCTAFAAGGPPNGDPGADAEVNTLGHELEEAKTDPRLNAWWTTSDGSENADKCAWTFGTVNLNGNTANITVGSKNFLVQRNWLNLSGGSCAQTYGGTTVTVPGAPNLTAATPGNAQVALTWSAPGSNGGAAIDGYYVYRNGTKISGLIGGTSYTNTGLTNGTSYSFTVTAHNSAGESAQSNSRSATPVAPTVPGAPNLTAATPGNAQVALAWSAPGSNGGAAIDGYYVYRNGSKITGLLGGTSYTDGSLTNGTSYSYTVTAHNSVGESTQSNSRSATPVAPTATVPGAPNLTSATAGNAQVALAWSAPSSDGGAAIDGYYVYRNGSKVTGLLGGTTYTDTSLTNGTSYSYTVTAHNSVGEGAQSNSRSATPSAGATAPGAVSLSAATNPRSCFFGNFFCSGGGVKLTWSAAASNGSAISQYRVYRSTSSTVSTSGSAYATSTSTTYTDSAASKGIVYYYKVVAVNGIGPGPDSNVASATAG